MDPKVFYGPLKKPAERPPDSDTETEVEEPPKKFKRLHRRTDNDRGPPRPPKDDEPIDISSRAGQRELVRRASAGDLNFVGRALQLGWQPTPEALVASAKLGHAEVVGMLLAFGSGDVNFNNITPLAAAIQENHAKVVQLLIDANVSLSWRDRLGRSYGDLAEKADSEVRKALADAYRARRERREKERDRQKDEKKREKREEKKERRNSRPETKERKDSRSDTKERKDSVPELKTRPSFERTNSNSRPKLTKEPSKESVPKDLKDSSKDQATKDEKESKEPTPQAAKENERPRRKTFSLSDYKNLKFTKAKEKEKEKEEAEKKKAEEGKETKAAEEAKEASKKVLKSPTQAVSKVSGDVPKSEARSESELESKPEEGAETPSEHSSEKLNGAESTGTEPKNPNSEVKVSAPSAPEPNSSTITNEKKRKETQKERAERAIKEVRGAAETAAKHTVDEATSAEKMALAAQELLTSSTLSTAESTKTEVKEAVPAAADVSAAEANGNIDPDAMEVDEPELDIKKPRVTFKEPNHEPSSDAMDTTGDNQGDDTDTSFTRTAILRDGSHSPRSPTIDSIPVAEKIAKRSEERKAFEALLAKRERERKAREAQMLQKLDIEEKRRKSEKTILPETQEVPKPRPDPKVVKQATGQLAKLPFILQRLACTGSPQDVGPLFVHRFTGTGGKFNQEPSKFHALDIQVGCLFGVGLHARYPDISKTPVSADDKQALWEFVSSWVCPEGCTPAEREEEFTKFNEMPLYWIKGDDVLNIGKDFDIKYRTVPIALHVPNDPATDGVLSELAQSLPINLAVRHCLRQQVYAWQ